jgi:hypothetical protein
VDPLACPAPRTVHCEVQTFGVPERRGDRTVLVAKLAETREECVRIGSPVLSDGMHDTTVFRSSGAQR